MQPEFQLDNRGENLTEIRGSLRVPPLHFFQFLLAKTAEPFHFSIGFSHLPIFFQFLVRILLMSFRTPKFDRGFSDSTTSAEDLPHNQI